MKVENCGRIYIYFIRNFQFSVFNFQFALCAVIRVQTSQQLQKVR